MIALIQRVSRASVTIDGTCVASIGSGILVLLGVMNDDAPTDAEYLARRTASLRIMNDVEGVPNISVLDAGHEALVVSQFTLCADTRKGNRPSYGNAAPPEIAEPLYNAFVGHLRTILGTDKIKTGVFRAMMQVELVNDGPVTLCLTSEKR